MLAIQVVIDNLVDVVWLMVIFNVYVIHDGTIQVNLEATALLFLFVLGLFLGIIYQELVVGRTVFWLDNEQVDVVYLDRPQSQLSV